MKILSKIITGVIIALLITSQTFAQEDVSQLQTRISELKIKHQELKSQVDAGTLSKEDAITQWKGLIEQVRTEKEAFFSSRVKKLNDVYQTILEKNPERAEIFKQRLDAVKTRREAITTQRKSINEQIKAGTLDPKEGRQMRLDILKQAQQDFKSTRQDIQNQGQDLRENKKLEQKKDIKPGIRNLREDRPEGKALLKDEKQISGDRPMIKKALIKNTQPLDTQLDTQN